MISVSLRFYEELNDFLAPRRRKTRFLKQLKEAPSVKDLIESCGVPHTEVDLILVNGISVSFDYRVSHGDDVSVYPVFESLDIGGLTRLQARPLRNLRFVADSHLGTLTRRMRLLGFDVVFDRTATQNAVVEMMLGENRVILTRNRGLLKQKIIQRGYCLHSDDPKHQTLEVIHRFDLVEALAPFTRCVRCNAFVEPVVKVDVLGSLKAKTREFYDTFTHCSHCGQVYWRGAHTKSLEEFITWIKKETKSW
ncbi:MAG: Mut7-C ubiquitin/RNAse domain-containing protein [Deltaproteobacteria bacterium]|nr:Mut7-C ubiquitin/RNAse domain-containing protein [Deltaproteobacteria bacterium]